MLAEGKLMNITYTNARNPKWGNPAKNFIDIEVNFSHIDEEYVPFSANPLDSMSYGVEIYNKAVAGDFGTIGDYTPPENITGSDAMTQLRKERDALLVDSDWMVLPDRTSTSEQLAYRKALRDLPANYPNCYLTWDADNGKYIWASVTWPTI